MEQGIGEERVTERPKRVWSKSWVAYVQPVIINFIVLAITSSIVATLSPTLGLLFICIGFCWIGYVIMDLNSYAVYVDNDGVWLYSGILPWKKGRTGVLWRDLDSAVFFQGFTNWMFNSYSIRIGHRYTKDSELLVTHIYDGKELVMAINDIHMHLARTQNLQ